MPIITDANVLIDYLEGDISTLSLYSEHIEKVIIPSVILDEVDGLSIDDCETYGFEVVFEELDLLFEASNSQHGPLSFQDKVCLYMAKEDKSITCITNEKALLKFCEKDGIPVKRGLKLIVELVQLKKLTKQVAISTVERIHRSNPLHINREVVEAFKSML